MILRAKSVRHAAIGRSDKQIAADQKLPAGIERPLHTKPDGATQCGTRSLAREVGVSESTIHRGWLVVSRQDVVPQIEAGDGWFAL